MEEVPIADNAEARLMVSRHAATLFWERGVAGTSGDDIATAAGLSTRTVWRYFRTKESCVEPVLATSLERFLVTANRWPADLSLGDHMAADAKDHPLTPKDVEDEISAMRIATLSLSDAALRTSYLMVHDEMERGLTPVIAKRLELPDDDLTVRLCAAAMTGALRVVDEEVSVAVIVEKRDIGQQEALALIDRAVREATGGRLGGPLQPR